MKILITGFSGELGRELVNELQHHELLLPKIEKLDLLKPKTIKNYNVDPDIIIHAAAMTSIEDAELNSEKCMKLNLLGTRRLVSRYPRAKFIYITTNSIYKEPDAKEHDVKNPCNVYYYYKYIAERELPKNSVILRCNFLTKKFVRNLIKCKEPFGYTNIIFNFLSVQNIARVIKEIVDEKEMPGIYNLTGDESISKYDLVKRILKDKNVKEVEYNYKNLGLPKRPLNSTPNNTKIKKYISTPLLNLEESILEVLSSI